MEDLFQVGVIVSTHGLRGEVNVFPTTDDVKRFKKLKKVILDTGKEHIELNVESVKYVKKFVILKFKEFNDINEVEQYKKKSLLVERKDAVKLEKDEYFIADMIGIDVFNEDGSKLGILKDVIMTGANDVYQVEMEDKGEVLIPAIKECILSVNIEERKIVVHLLKGLL